MIAQDSEGLLFSYLSQKRGTRRPYRRGLHYCKDEEAKASTVIRIPFGKFRTECFGSETVLMISPARPVFMKRNPEPHFLERNLHPLPSETDFDPHGGDLDAQSAWRSFGNLSLEQAYSLFCSRPEVYQEDFMFMGCRAFEYYFPVIDRYLREIRRGEDDTGDCEASILGSAVAAQFEWDAEILSDSLVQDINALQEFIVHHVDRYAATPKDRTRILREWQRVAELCEKHKEAD